MYDLHELIERARAHLAQLGYSVLSMREHEYSWRRLLEWCDREGITGYDHDAESRYLNWAGLSDANITQRRRAERTHVTRLPAIAETGDLPRFRPKRRFEVPEGFGGAYEAYSSELERRGLSDSTRAGYLHGPAILRQLWRGLPGGARADLPAIVRQHALGDGRADPIRLPVRRARLHEAPGKHGDVPRMRRGRRPGHTWPQALLGPLGIYGGRGFRGVGRSPARKESEEGQGHHAARGRPRPRLGERDPPLPLHRRGIAAADRVGGSGMQRVIEFTGPYARLLRECVELRQGLGFTMAEGSQRTLRHFAAHLCEDTPISEVVDERRACEFLAKRPGESENTRPARCVVVRQSCLHLRRIGIAAYWWSVARTCS